MAKDDFVARRTARVKARIEEDGDTWVEALAVCEIPTRPGFGDQSAGAKKKAGSILRGSSLLGKFRPGSKNADSETDSATVEQHAGGAGKPYSDEDLSAAAQRLTLRPYFQSQNTGERVWDEPPSGASNILFASPEARRMAEAQLEEMGDTFAKAAMKRRKAREELIEAEKDRQRKADGPGKLPSLSRVFKRSSKVSSPSKASLLGDDNREVLGGSLVLRDEGPVPKSVLDESRQMAGVECGKSYSRSRYEEDLEMAISMSLDAGGGSVMGTGDNQRRNTKPMYVTEKTSGDPARGLSFSEQEQLAMALSLSEQESRVGDSGSSKIHQAKFWTCEEVDLTDYHGQVENRDRRNR
ncbi:hypothetical protein THAOC_01603 [Thalassiosira oceanica]|uniref:Uncharacterized protein n=1 Tax=Thalassiosira oceanica TaxID=159749 RepID=K0TQT8_THAOC|nr:hypothetical protein THAOC_01603 [Thalassiosira oceanica]|mmetsp:Transcript_19635/g.43747  ORF Transcript_19635/g.43747 Transcript_19635/m.43747 type:complete len:354 (-) Transcript_19635:92-1153(-)|eukprot:EJK76622.1 hypothetical protein THAOC_01603 [Thalassiosira oceanica]